MPSCLDGIKQFGSTKGTDMLHSNFSYKYMLYLNVGSNVRSEIIFIDKVLHCEIQLNTGVMVSNPRCLKIPANSLSRNNNLKMIM